MAQEGAGESKMKRTLRLITVTSDFVEFYNMGGDDVREKVFHNVTDASYRRLAWVVRSLVIRGTEGVLLRPFLAGLAGYVLQDRREV